MDQSFRHYHTPDEPLRTELQPEIDQGEQKQAVLAELYREMQVELHARACRWLGDAGLAEDHVQDVFLQMYLNFDSMIAHGSPQTWIRTTARNRLIDRYRNRISSARKEVGDVSDDFEKVLEHDLAGKTWANRFDEQVATWVGIVEPVLAYVRTVVAIGWVRPADMRAYWQGVVEGVTQQELARQSGLSQGRISQLKSEVGRHVRTAIYVCELLGTVRPPHRDNDIRYHLDLLDLAEGITPQDRVLLRQAGSAIRRDSLDQPVLSPEDAQAAIQPRKADDTVTLRELHDAESRYATAIPNSAPHCIDSPCPVHTAPPDVNEGRIR